MLERRFPASDAFFFVSERSMRLSTGKVFLIGAGPGAADLLTIRAVQRLAQADVVLVDDLVDASVLSQHCPRARVIRVGKRGGCRSTPQAFINRLMLRYARHGCNVARVKGGDPFVFGRGAEEKLFLEQHGVVVEVVPGLTAGIAVPALAGIPVTHRATARSVTLVTGHTCNADDPDWSRLAASGSTLVIYMGLQRIDAIVQSLLRAGMKPETPVAVIAQGTRAGEVRVVSTLATAPYTVRASGLCAPALIVIGEVVNLAADEARLVGQAAWDESTATKEATA